MRSNPGLDAFLRELGRNGGQGRRAQVKLAFGGSVVKNDMGELCLRGEERGAFLDGVQMFAALNGRKGFFKVGELDPNDRGGIVGRLLNTEAKAEESERKAGAKGGWGIPISRTALAKAETEDGKNALTFMQFDREMRITEDGRIVGLTKEAASTIAPTGIAKTPEPGPGPGPGPGPVKHVYSMVVDPDSSFSATWTVAFTRRSPEGEIIVDYYSTSQTTTINQLRSAGMVLYGEGVIMPCRFVGWHYTFTDEDGNSHSDVYFPPGGISWYNPPSIGGGVGASFAQGFDLVSFSCGSPHFEIHVID